MKIIRGFVLAFFISILSLSVYSQNSYDNDIGIVESLNDSMDLVSNFYDFYDGLMIYFHPSENIYSNWDNKSIHYPKKDFSKKTDTTLIVLQDRIGKFVVPVNGRITSHFGPRRSRYHYGTDIDLETGDTVRCAFDGMVRITQYNKGYGNVVVVRHDNGLETLYGHLSKIMTDSNKTVKAGDVLGLGGNTGRSYGSHLHFEVRYLGTPFNSEKIVDYNNKKLISDTLQLCKSTFKYQAKIIKMKSASYYTVRKGDTLGRIAVRNGTSITSLCRLNGISRNSTLRIGKRLRVR